MSCLVTFAFWLDWSGRRKRAQRKRVAADPMTMFATLPARPSAPRRACPHAIYSGVLIPREYDCSNLNCRSVAICPANRARRSLGAKDCPFAEGSPVPDPLSVSNSSRSHPHTRMRRKACLDEMACYDLRCLLARVWTVWDNAAVTPESLRHSLTSAMSFVRFPALLAAPQEKGAEGAAMPSSPLHSL
jgi:hypothetical protein